MRLSAAEETAVARLVDAAELAELLQPELLRRGAYLKGDVPPSLRRFVDEERNFCGGLTNQADGGEPLRFVMSPAEVWEMQSFSVLDRQRDALLAKLLFAARSLAQKNLMAYGRLGSVLCVECSASSRGGAPAHAGTCETGRVLGLIAELVKNGAALAAYAGEGGGR